MNAIHNPDLVASLLDPVINRIAELRTIDDLDLLQIKLLSLSIELQRRVISEVRDRMTVLQAEQAIAESEQP